MTKKINLLLLIILITSVANAQTKKEAEVVKTKKNLFEVNNQFKKPSKDYVMLQTGFHTWLLPTNTTISKRETGHDLNAYVCYDFPMAKKHFSFAIGAGIASSNIYLNHQKLNFTDTSSVAYFTTDTFSTLKRYKLSFNYFEVPFEFRYFANQDNRNRGFKASLGVKVGALLNAHNKEVISEATGNYKNKESTRRFFETWRIMPTARIGWGNFSVYGAYQINELFKVNNTQGIGISPLSIGICLSGL